MIGRRALPHATAFDRPGPVVRHRRQLICGVALAGLLLGMTVPSGHAASNGPNLDAGNLVARPSDPDAPMLLEADTLTYDFDRNLVSATGKVEIHYGGYTLLAQKVSLDRKTNRMRAEGGVKITEPDGNILLAESIDLSDDLRDGFVKALVVETTQRTRIAAESGQRIAGNEIIFEKGVYTACASCTETPDKPPTWAIKAARIIHNREERVIHYEQPRIEFWGVPVAYLPYLSHPDPTVGRRSGFLVPKVVYSEQLGAGVSIPYYWALGPDKDLTATLTPLSRQGALASLRWRQRLMDGAYSIRAAGIYQLDPSAFSGSVGDQPWRGTVSSKGEFWINPNWKWGWDGTIVSDRTFLVNYKQPQDSNEEAISSLYMTGLGEKNYADVRAMAFQVLQENGVQDGTTIPPASVQGTFSLPGEDLQSKQPYIWPVVDYNAILDSSVYGGQLAYNMNFTTLTRSTTDAFWVENDNGTYDTRFRGVAGTYNRTSIDGNWKRQMIGPLGQVFTPYVGMRGDLFLLQSTDEHVTALDNESAVGRFMPTAAMEYRWPWLISAVWGSQVVEPIAQLVVRPGETGIGKLPNEDSQSLVFDDTTVFDYDKFSGWDRVEGGTRANLGVQYTLQTGAGFVSALLGQSYQLAGPNSFTRADLLDSTADSGLDTNASDYVGRLSLTMMQGMKIGTQVRLDDKDLSFNRAGVSTLAMTGPLTTQITYMFLRAQPELGDPYNRQEVQGSGSLRLVENWRLFGSLRYDIQNKNVVTDGIGLGYDDESFSLSVAYAEDRSQTGGVPVDRTVFLRLGLRTIGDTQLSSSGL